MNKDLEIRRPIWRVLNTSKGLGALVVLGILFLVLAFAAVSSARASAADRNIEVWPAYYQGDEVQMMMGPGGNSANPNQLGAGATCFNLGPAGTGGPSPKAAPVFYFIFYPDATQMWCVDEEGGAVDGTKHDMILTVVPGDRGYNATVEGMGCAPGDGFSPPYTSAAEVADAIDGDNAGQLLCESWGTQLAPIVLGP